MDRTYRGHKHHHQPRGLVRSVAGWSLVGLGLAMMILPGPGLLALAVGIAVIGPRDPAIRRGSVLFWLGVRRLSQSERPLVRRVGIWLRHKHRCARLFIDEQLRRHARGQPFSPLMRLWIVVTVAIALAGLGVGLYMILS